MRRIFTVIAALTALVTLPAQAETSAEDAFRNASGWTVQVRTAIDRSFAEESQGSFEGAGVLVDTARGWVLTNAHVAGYSYGHISVAFEDGRYVPAQRVYVDPFIDLAIIAYDRQKVRYSPSQPVLECSGIPAVGHPVGAFGHPWGYRFTGTRGIASAVTSRLGPKMLQTDAPINHGNSGGPLISLETGRVVGINTASLSKDETEGMSFAVLIPYACTILRLLQEGKDPSPPAHLVDFALDSDEEGTLLVARSRLPAGSLDLRAGDTVVAVGEPRTAIQTESDLIDAVRGRLDDVDLTVKRAGGTVELRGSWPAAEKITQREGLWISGALFATSDAFTNGLVTGRPALMVHHVEPGSAAEMAGLHPFDLLAGSDGREIDSLATLESMARKAGAAGRPLELVLLRFGGPDQMLLFQHHARQLEAGEIERVGPTARKQPR